MVGMCGLSGVMVTGTVAWHGGVVVTMPASGREGLGFKSHPGRLSFGHQVVYTGVEESHDGRSLTQ